MCSLSSHSHKFNFPILFVYLLIGVKSLNKIWVGLQQWYHNLFTNFNSIYKSKIIYILWVCWFSGFEIYVYINYSYVVINDYSENAPTYWETWYAQKGFRRRIIILSILIATFVHFFNVESHIFSLTYLWEIHTHTQWI